MNIEKINLIIKQLKEIKEGRFSPQNDELFDDAKNMLMKDAPVGLKSRLVNLNYCDYTDPLGEPIPNIGDIKKLIQLYEDELFNLQAPSSKEDLYKKKLLKAKKNDIDFLVKLGEMIVGDIEGFPYRSSSYITKFFAESGFPELIHDGSTRRFWTAKQLENMSMDNLYKIIQNLFKRRYFNDKNADIDKAKEIFSNILETSSQVDETIDISELFGVDINTSLLFDQEIKTDDNVLNSDIDEAKSFYLKGDMQNAIEKIWDAFERVKSYYGANKKESINNIVETLSDEIKATESGECTDFEKLFFNTELKDLTNIGNAYKIRHSEVKQKVLKNDFTKKYLFLRVLNLINLIHTRMN